jgi:hypothetical protein
LLQLRIERGIFSRFVLAGNIYPVNRRLNIEQFRSALPTRLAQQWNLR